MDLDLHCFLKKNQLDSAGQGLRISFFCHRPTFLKKMTHFNRVDSYEIFPRLDLYMDTSRKTLICTLLEKVFFEEGMQI